ncbi:MAG: LysR family transcriptional regulator [Rhizobiaceae bacterium]
MGDNKKLALQKLAAAASLLESVARTESFTEAAQELGIQQSAVSHRIRSLEAVLGFALFTRTTRKVAPTHQGILICRACQVSNEAISSALDQATRVGEVQNTVLSLPSSLAMKWLVPAMKRAQERRLKITLNIDEQLTALGQNGMPHAAIRFGPGPYAGLHTTLLCKCHVMPVAHKRLAKFLRPKTGTPSVLLRDITAEEDGTGMTWESYLGDDYDAARFDLTVSFSRSDVALQAAISGLGHALGRTLLVENDLDAGLVTLSGPLVAIKSRYWLVTTADFAATSAYERLVGWLHSEVRRSKTILGSHALS